ncbi:hypothetical protein RJ639_041585 [Escallonia herrerae]|uniref:AB hydrolase-1 domain-containing protein n=1 Tax=Escallonia herrerae TaxID=1293975 RepID=A0AA89B2V9_9ASTE|nr:hypothetical protein RJ639_041585 [Escallonia herrerae]
MKDCASDGTCWYAMMDREWAVRELVQLIGEGERKRRQRRIRKLERGEDEGVTEEDEAKKRSMRDTDMHKRRLRFLNEYLPEDRDPTHSWSVVLVMLFLAVASILVNTEIDTTSQVTQKLCIHPPNATRILLPDGRHLAYQEQGIPGIKTSLLQEFGVRFITYDLPGFGDSDPHPNRNLESSIIDMLHLSYVVGVIDKFWVVGYSSGSMHAWAALRYIPDRLAAAFMVAPIVNPYEPSMNKEERRRIWEKWTLRKKLMYFLARRFPRILPYFYRQSFLSGNLAQVDEWLSLSLGRSRDVVESVWQGSTRPFVEKAVLQVSSSGFSLGDLKLQKKLQKKGIIFWFKSLYNQAEEDLTGFLGPIHIWQGINDRVGPPVMSDFVAASFTSSHGA